ncbi:MAG: hypothetical protein ABJB12_01320 [Pseudomonadota bacterium]
MSSHQSGLLFGVCLLVAAPGFVSCGGNAQPSGTGGGGASGSSAGSDSAGAAGVPGQGGGTSGASAGGMSVGGASVGGASVGGASVGGAPSGGAGMGGAASGGAHAGGAPSGGMGGGAGAAGAGGASGCSGLSQTRFARTGKSAGFSGSYQTDYYPLYSHACNTLADCSAACVTAGGTEASCAASECEMSTPNYCLPPTYWVDFDKLLTEGSGEGSSVETGQESSVWIIMVNNPYRDQLLASNFQFEIPSGAKIAGISFAITEAAGSENMIADYSVRALANNAVVGLDRGHSTAWTTTFHPEVYGGATDLWGATWTADAVNAAGFGVALTPLYLDTAGNERAYVDFIRATVTYDTCQ